MNNDASDGFDYHTVLQDMYDLGYKHGHEIALKEEELKRLKQELGQL